MAALELLALDEATPQVVAPQAGDTATLPLTLNAATGDEVALDLSVTVNKATSGNYTGIKLDVTETAAPGSDDKLLHIQEGGTDQLILRANGLGDLLIGGSSNTWLRTTGAASDIFVGSGLTDKRAVIGSRTIIPSFGYIGFHSASTVTNTTSYDVSMRRSAAGIIVLTDSGGTAGGSLKLDLTTEDRGFINFAGTADADATSAISTLTTSGATTHHVQMALNGVKCWVAVSTNPPTA